MNKQLIAVTVGAITVLLLFFFGKTSVPHKPAPATAEVAAPSFDIAAYITRKKDSLSPSQSLTLSALENSVKRGDVAAQQIRADESIAAFWRDSLRAFEPYAYYTAEAAKLDNSEKKLTFAARLFSEQLRNEQDERKLTWETATAKDLYERAIVLDPNNDDLHIGLGSCYIFGRNETSDPQQTMKGIGELLSVVRKDSNNMKAQLVLGVGGIVSGQYDKAIERLNKVVAAEPQNPEAVSFLADAYAAKGDKENAIKWYNVSKRLLNSAAYNKEVDERIKNLK